MVFTQYTIQTKASIVIFMERQPESSCPICHVCVAEYSIVFARNVSKVMLIVLVCENVMGRLYDNYECLYGETCVKWQV